MNKKQRKELGEVVTKLDDAITQLDWIRDDESYKLSNLPEYLENSEMYQKIEEAVDNIEEAIDLIKDGKELIEELSETY